MDTLQKLYQEQFEKLCQAREAFPNEELNGPFLMEPTTYFEQSIKLLIVGQETYGWSCEYKNINAQLKTYREFNHGQNYRSSPFWNITRKIEDILEISPYSCAWTNLNRYDHNGRAPTGKILDELLKLDFLVKEEIEILKPDVCMFFTNWKYDDRIKSLYDKIEFQDIEGLPTGHFSRLVHATLPGLTFRTPHPKTIRVQKWEDAFSDAMRKTLISKKV